MIHRGRTLTLLAALAVAAAASADNPRPMRTYDEVCADIAASGPEAVEGVWRLTAPGEGGALVAVERDPDAAGSYAITVVEAPDRSLLPGTLVGRATRGAERGVYDAWMWADAPLPGITPRTRRQMTLRLTDGGNRLTFEPHRRPWAVNLYMSVPYLFIRPSVRNDRFAERTPQGAERVFPTPVPPIEPVYL